MLNKVQMKYMIQVVLKGDNVDRAQAFLDKHHKRVYLEKLRTHGQFDLFEVGD